MPFIAHGKTNWKYILIIVVLAVIVGGGIVVYSRDFIKEIVSISQSPVAIVKKTKKLLQKRLVKKLLKKKKLLMDRFLALKNIVFL